MDSASFQWNCPFEEVGLEVTDVSEHTGFPEMMDGRVKTLHPKVHGGLLCLRDNPSHREAAESQGVEMIDLVVVNLYPFENRGSPGVYLAEAIEQIDIGGPSMLRSAAKNHRDVTVVCDPEDYSRVLEAFEAPDQLTSLRAELARKVFARTAAYDTAISAYLEKQAEVEPDLEEISGFPAKMKLEADKAMTLRYGENPHQQAALYGDFLDHFKQLQGNELSFNNILDVLFFGLPDRRFEKPRSPFSSTPTLRSGKCGSFGRGMGTCLRHRPAGPFWWNHCGQ